MSLKLGQPVSDDLIFITKGGRMRSNLSKAISSHLDPPLKFYIEDDLWGFLRPSLYTSLYRTLVEDISPGVIVGHA